MQKLQAAVALRRAEKDAADGAVLGATSATAQAEQNKEALKQAALTALSDSRKAVEAQHIAAAFCALQQRFTVLGAEALSLPTTEGFDKFVETYMPTRVSISPP